MEDVLVAIIEESVAVNGLVVADRYVALEARIVAHVRFGDSD
jgi:hypothetical protein